MVLDGRFDDWESIPKLLAEDSGDAADSLVDFADVRAVQDGEHVYLSFAVGSLINLQSHAGSISLAMPAMNMELVFSPLVKAGSPGRGALLLRAGKRSSAYEIGLLQAPTHAARRFEIRMDRRELLAGDGSFTGKLLFRDAIGRVQDETDMFSLEARSLETGGVLASPSLASQGDFRALSWNTEHGGLVARKDAFLPLLASFDADLLFLQEIEGAEPARELADWFRENLPGAEPWHVLVAAEGGDLRSALVSRFPMEPVDLGLEKGSIGAERLALGLVKMGERKLLALSVHLRCCGRMDSPEDELRIEAARQIRRALDLYLNEHVVDGVILAGDLNLVGSRAPLEILAGAHLRISEPLSSDGQQMVTWRDAKGSFLPGRLDYLLHTPGRPRVERGMVFEPTGTGHASDHLPLIFDFSW